MPQPLIRSLHLLRLALPLALMLALAPRPVRAELVLTTPYKTLGMGSLRAAIYTADGSGIYAAGNLGVISLHDARTGKVKRTFTGHTAAVNCLALTPDGKRLLSGGSDRTARLWDAASGALLKTCKAPEAGAIVSVALTPDAQTIATGSLIGQYAYIRLWKSTSQSTLLASGQSSTYDPQCPVALSHDGRTLAGAVADRNVKLWDVASGALRHTFVDHTAAVRSVAFSPDGKVVLSGSHDKTAIAWNIASGDVVGYYTGHGDLVNSAVYSPDGKSVITAANDLKVRIWNVATGQLTRTLTLPGAAASARFSADGAKIITPVPGKYQVLQWNAADGAALPKLSGYAGAIKAAALSPDGRLLVTGHVESVARLWDLASGELKYDVPAPGVSAIAFTPDGSQFIAAGNVRAYQWNTATGAELGSFTYNEYAPIMAISDDGKRILFRSPIYISMTQYSFSCYDFLTRQRLHSYTGQCNSYCFMPGGYNVMVGRSNGAAELLNADTGAVIRTFTGHMGPIIDVKAFAKGERLLTGSEDGSARIWNVANGFPIRTFPVGAPVKAVAAAAHGRRVLTGASDLRLWDAVSGALIARFSHGSVTAVGFTPDGNLYSVGGDGRIRLWRQPLAPVPATAWSRYE